MRKVFLGAAFASLLAAVMTGEYQIRFWIFSCLSLVLNILALASGEGKQGG